MYYYQAFKFRLFYFLELPHGWDRKVLEDGNIIYVEYASLLNIFKNKLINLS
jgi:hypothetical protein